jgi:hypothetical protein
MPPPANARPALATDIPNIWAYFGELIASAVVAESLPLSAMHDICAACSPFQKSHVMAVAILKVMAQEQGVEKVAEAWRSSGLQWADFASPSCDIQEYLDRNVSDAFGVWKLVDFVALQNLGLLNSNELTQSQNKEQLMRLVTPKASNQEIIRWIKDNVTEQQQQSVAFARSLTTAVCTSVIDGERSRCVM